MWTEQEHFVGDKEPTGTGPEAGMVAQKLSGYALPTSLGLATLTFQPPAEILVEILFSQQDILKLRRDRVQPSLLGVSYPSLPHLLPAALYPPTLLLRTFLASPRPAPLRRVPCTLFLIVAEYPW